MDTNDNYFHKKLGLLCYLNCNFGLLSGFSFSLPIIFHAQIYDSETECCHNSNVSFLRLDNGKNLGSLKTDNYIENLIKIYIFQIFLSLSNFLGLIVKYLTAPIFDSISDCSFAGRKSYLCLCYLFSAVGLFWIGNQMDEKIEYNIMVGDRINQESSEMISSPINKTFTSLNLFSNPSNFIDLSWLKMNPAYLKLIKFSCILSLLSGSIDISTDGWALTYMGTGRNQIIVYQFYFTVIGQLFTGPLLVFLYLNEFNFGMVRLKISFFGLAALFLIGFLILIFHNKTSYDKHLGCETIGLDTCRSCSSDKQSASGSNEKMKGKRKALSSKNSKRSSSEFCSASNMFPTETTRLSTSRSSSISMNNRPSQVRKIALSDIRESGETISKPVTVTAVDKSLSQVVESLTKSKITNSCESILSLEDDVFHIQNANKTESDQLQRDLCQSNTPTNTTSKDRNRSSSIFSIVYISRHLQDKAAETGFSRRIESFSKLIKNYKSLWQRDSTRWTIILFIVNQLPFSMMGIISKMKLVEIGICKRYIGIIGILECLSCLFTPVIFNFIRYKPLNILKYSFYGKFVSAVIFCLCIFRILHRDSGYEKELHQKWGVLKNFTTLDFDLPKPENEPQDLAVVMTLILVTLPYIIFSFFNFLGDIASRSLANTLCEPITGGFLITSLINFYQIIGLCSNTFCLFFIMGSSSYQRTTLLDSYLWLAVGLLVIGLIGFLYSYRIIIRIGKIFRCADQIK